MALSIVPGSEVHTPTNGVRLDPGPLREAALAPGKLGAAIGRDVGGLFDDISQKLQANRNARTVFDADLTMRKAKDDFTASLVQRPDENTWVPAWQEQASAVKDQVMSNPNAGPEVRRHLSQMYDTWNAANGAEVRMKALEKGVKESHDSAVAAATMAYQSGAPTAITDGDNIYKAAVAHYAMGDKEAKIYMTKGHEVAAEAVAGRIIADDPINAPEKIKPLENQVPGLKWKGLFRAANEAKSQQQTRNYNEFSEAIDLAPDHTMDPDALRKAVDSGDIKQSHMDRLVLRMKTATETTAKERVKAETQAFNVAMLEVQSHDWVDDQTPQKTIEGMKASGLEWTNPALRRRLNEYVDTRFKSFQKQGESEERPVEKQIFSQMEEDRTHNGMTVPLTAPTRDKDTDDFVPSKHLTGGLTKLRDEKYTDEELKTDFGPKATRESVLKAEQAHYANIQAKMRDWFKDPANKDATYDEANAYRMQLEKPYVMTAVSHALTPKKKADATPGKRVKQSGVTYEFDGKDWKAVH